MSDTAKAASGSGDDDPKLAHPVLKKVPLQLRFGLSGLLGNVLFMILYNTAVIYFDDMYPASTIYMVVYFLFIPVTHALVSLLVFGWPTNRYFTSLASNYPIGLTGMLVGSLCTWYLDKISFNEMVESFIRDSAFPPATERVATDDEDDDDDDVGEFYSSLVVLAITSVLGYTLSVMVNGRRSSPSTTTEEEKEKKEL